MNRSAFDLYVRGMNGNKDGKGVLDMFGDFQGFFTKGLLPGPDGVTKAIHQPELALKLKQADLFSPASKAYGAPTLELENYRRQIAVIRREGDLSLIHIWLATSPSSRFIVVQVRTAMVRLRRPAGPRLRQRASYWAFFSG